MEKNSPIFGKNQLIHLLYQANHSNIGAEIGLNSWNEIQLNPHKSPLKNPTPWVVPQNGKITSIQGHLRTQQPLSWTSDSGKLPIYVMVMHLDGTSQYVPLSSGFPVTEINQPGLPAESNINFQQDVSISVQKGQNIILILYFAPNLSDVSLINPSFVGTFTATLTLS